MAAVLDALAPYVKKLIMDMAQEEVSMLLGVSGEITKLEYNMESIKAFLKDAERRRLTDQSVQRWVRKLNDAMYDATDILDLCQLEADERREAEGGSVEPNQLVACCEPLLMCLRNPTFTLITCGSIEKLQDFFQRFLFCLRNPMFAHEIGSRIKKLNQRLDSIHKEADWLNFTTNLGTNPESRKPTDAEKYRQKMTSEFDESAIVGEKIEKDTRELAQLLITNGNQDIKVVSIVGTGGMGKTTLAQKIFNEATVQKHFKVKVWLSITQHFDEAELLKSAIEHAGGRVNHGMQDKTLLTRTLTDTLSTGKFLLVLDDIWDQKAWSELLSVPIRNASQKQPGSWVLITTRSRDLAQQMGAYFYQHQASPLDKEDAWSLLKKQLTPNQVAGIDMLKNIGMEILRRCDGLPLAIKVVGGLLSTRNPSESEWKAILNDRAWSVAGLPPDLDSRLYLSYEDLSAQVKQCFLYCSLFPEGFGHHLIAQMWISEGFIQPPDGDIATKYYRELIKRNLIEPIKRYSATRSMCSMHDVVRSFAKHMAREESMVVVDDKELQHARCGKPEAAAIYGGGAGGMLVRRLCVMPTVSVAEWAVLQRQKSLRTLIIHSRLNFQPSDSLGSFSSLRVLCITSVDFDSRLVTSLSKLKHLRHLHLWRTDISMLPDDIHEMKFLVFIELLDCKKLGRLPSSIINLVHLRTLNITGSNNVSSVPKGFGGLTNLRTLLGFPVHVETEDDAGSSSWCSLQELGPLSQLRHLALYGLEKVSNSWMAEKAMISSKAHLSYLELNYYNNSASGHTTGPEQQQQQSLMEDVSEKLCPPTSLENLVVRGGYAGRQLPNWMRAPAASADFKSLRFLTLKNLPCCTQLPDGLCCLPCLEVLDIQDAPAVKRIGPEFQASSSSLLSPPFPKMRELYLFGLCEWEEWEWNDDSSCEEEQGDVNATVIAMPCLETLNIRNCKLSCLPPGLANSKRLALRTLCLYKVTNLESVVENFPSVVELDVFGCPELKRISGLSRLQKIWIVRCPNVEVLEGVPSLDSLLLDDATMETLPGYLQDVSPRYLELKCGKKLYESLSPGGSEWNKINHIGKHNIISMED